MNGWAWAAWLGIVLACAALGWAIVLIPLAFAKHLRADKARPIPPGESERP